VAENPYKRPALLSEAGGKVWPHAVPAPDGTAREVGTREHVRDPRSRGRRVDAGPRWQDRRRQGPGRRRRLNDLYARSDAAVEAYNKAVSQLHAVRRAIARNTVLLNRAKRNLAAARAQLAEFVVSSYKGAGPSLTYYVLSASSFTDLVNRMDFVNRMSDTESTILGEVRKAEREVAARQAVLKHQRAVAAKLVAKRAAEQRRVQALVSQQQSLVSNLNSHVKTLIHQRDERRAAAAAAAAAAARRAAQQPSTPAPPPRSGGTPPPASSLGERAVQIAETQLGVPYVFGGASPSGFDCSGLTMWTYAQLGISLAHYTGFQWTAGPHVPYDQLAPGDLVFFEPTIGHVGIYIGGGSFIHAPHTGDVVKISSLSDSWYAANYQGAVRVTG